MDNKDLIRVEISKVQLGMWVHALDIPWIGSGFMLEGFLVDGDNLEQLKKRCKFIVVSKKLSAEGMYAPELDEAPVKKEPIKKPKVEVEVVVEKQPFFQGLVDNLLGMLGLERKSKSEAREQPQIQIEPNQYSSASDLKQDAIIFKKAQNVISEFISHDGLVSGELEQHAVTTDVNEEYVVAEKAKETLNKNINEKLFSDVNNTELMQVVLADVTASVTDVVSSMIRNPDAMRLVEDIRAYDNLSYKHAVDASILMIAFGRELSLPAKDLIEIGLGALLHDIGEVKPQNQRQVVRNIAMYDIYKKNHISDGLEILKKSPLSEIVKVIISQHHERYDGKGYPNELKKSQISLYGAMMAIVDYYISASAGRNMVQPISPSSAMSKVMSKAGKEFDPKLCDIFSQIIGVYPVGSYVELVTGEIAQVIKQNRLWRLKPVVQILTDQNKKPISKPVALDLLGYVKNNEIAIKREFKIKR